MHIVFVCTGNICRSPTAEGVMRHMLEQAGLSHRITVDSAGTHGYHIGEPPDPRTVQAALRRGYDLSALRARKVSATDYRAGNLLLALDAGHLTLLKRGAPKDAQAHPDLFLRHAGVEHTHEVPDPYYGDAAGFEHVLDLIEEGAQKLLERLIKNA